jgi:hypothetical protein
MKRWVFWLAVGTLTIFALGLSGCHRGPGGHDQEGTNDSLRVQDYLADTYFWLTDTTMAGDGRAVANFRDNYRHYVSGQRATPPTAQQIRACDLYLSVTPTTYASYPHHPGRATALRDIADWALPAGQFPVDPSHLEGHWVRYTDLSSLALDSVLGVVRLNDPSIMALSPHALAVAFSTVGGDTFGTLGAPSDGLRLVLLRAPQPAATDATWNLMFRHVYRLETMAGLASLNLQIAHAEDSTESELLPDSSESYLSFFQFDRRQADGSAGPDGQLDDNPLLWMRYVEEIQFLDLTPFDPSGYWEDGQFVRWDLVGLETRFNQPFRVPDLYRQTPDAISASWWPWRLKYLRVIIYPD